MSSDLSESELERYSAQIERIGVEGQLRLRNARAIVIGAGPAGSAAAAELVSRGVGYVAVADGSVTALCDLCGQASLYTPDVGANRAEALTAKLGILNPNVHVDPYPVDVDEANAAAIVMGHDVALDFAGTAGALLAAACTEHRVELISADGTGTVAGVIAAGAAVNHLTAGVAAAEGVR